MLVKWTMQKGALVPLHFHPNEQITWITQGSVKVSSQGKEFIVKAGEVLSIPPNVPHEFLTLEDNTIDIDFFMPTREDWLNNTAGYIQSIQKNSCSGIKRLTLKFRQTMEKHFIKENHPNDRHSQKSRSRKHPNRLAQ